MSPLPPRPDLWSLDPRFVHLNHGSFGAVPRRTQEVAAALRAENEANPMAWSRGIAARKEAARLALAAYLETDPSGLALVPNASAGVTVALATLHATGAITSDKRIVVTDQAYGAVRYAAERTARQSGAALVTVALPLGASNDAVVAALAAELDGAGVLVVDQITSGTASVLPVDRLAELCADAGVPIVVDGAHAPAQLDAPVIDGADFWTGNFHKWPCAPRGTGCLAVAPRWRDVTLPPIVSWNEHEPFPRRFDLQATNDYVAWLAAPTSLDVLAELDWPRRRVELAAMLDELAPSVAKSVGMDVPPLARPAPLMRLAEVPPMPRDAVEPFKARAAREIGVELTLTGHGGRTFIRLSAHAYNAPQDYEVLAERLPALF